MCGKWFRVALGAALLALAACPTRDISQLPVTPAIEVKKEIPVSTNRNVDILFLIDNSSSTSDKQNVLAANFPVFINVLQAIPGGLPNVHIGVASSDVGVPPYTQEQCSGTGDHGLLQNTAHGSCPVPNAGARFISDITLPNNTHQINYPSGQLSQTFSCIARLGATGCGFEQHLEGMKEALDGSNPENAGFLRDDAYLAVIVLADEDDCSSRDNAIFDPNPQLDNTNSILGVNASYRCTEFGVLCNGAPIPRVAADYQNCTPRGDSYLWHPQHYYDFLRTLKGDPNLLIGAVIAGNPTPFGVTLDTSSMANPPPPVLKHSCSFQYMGDDWVADPAVRLKYWVDQFGTHGTFVSVCQADFSDALTRIGQLLAKIVGTPCLEGAIDDTDINPTEPGLQLNCQVSDVKFPDSANPTETVLPRCPMTGPTTPNTATVPCWWTDVEPTVCTTALNSETHVALHVERGGADAPIGTFVVAKCVSNE
jgi:hypothetical protein